MDKTIERLEAWKSGSKARWVEISIDNGYGASCWQVTLGVSLNKKIEAYEVAFMTHGELPPEVVIVNDGNHFDDWPGLAATINAAIDRAESLGFKTKENSDV